MCLAVCVAVCISPSVVLEGFYGGLLRVHGSPAMVEGGFKGLDWWLSAVSGDSEGVLAGGVGPRGRKRACRWCGLVRRVGQLF